MTDLLNILKQYGIEDETSLTALLQNLNPVEKIDLIKMLQRKSNYNYKQYVPQDYQLGFHKSPAFIRLFLGGNRSGKTFGCLHDLLWYLTGDYPEWFPAELKRETPFYARWIATDFKHGVGDVFQKEFCRIVPGPYTEGPVVKHITRTQQGIFQKVLFQNGSELGLMTDQQDLEEFEGWSGHRLDIDEPCGYQKYIASARGLVDYSGRVCMHLTPLAEPWIYDDIYTKQDGKTIFCIEVSSYDNKYNSKDKLAQFETQMASDPDLRDARILGKFKHLKGLVYKNLDRDSHTITDFEIPSNYPVIHIMDPHDRKPHNMIWAAINEYGHYIVIGNLETTGTVLEISHQIKQIERKNNWKVQTRIGDPNKFKAPAAVGQTGSLESEFGKYGLYFYTKVNDSIEQGHHAVRQKLHWDKTKSKRLGNQPGLYFFKEGAKQCFNEMLRYTFYEEKNPDDRGMKEKPKEAHKDYPDCIRYLVMAAPEYENMTPYPEPLQEFTGDSVCGY